MGVVLNPYMSFPPAPSGVETTWNSGDKNSNITLSNGNLTATNTTETQGSVRSTNPHSSGKYYFEVTANQITPRVGLATSTFVLSTTSGQTTESIIYSTSLGAVRYDATTLAPAWGPPNVNGIIVSVAYDGDNNKVWFRVNGGDWLGNVSHDPATNSGGHTIGDDTWYPLLGGSDGFIATANFGATSFAYTPPSGFIAWNA